MAWMQSRMHCLAFQKCGKCFLTQIGSRRSRALMLGFFDSGDVSACIKPLFEKAT
jgi:hypothetical protein